MLRHFTQNHKCVGTRKNSRSRWESRGCSILAATTLQLQRKCFSTPKLVFSAKKNDLVDKNPTNQTIAIVQSMRIRASRANNSAVQDSSSRNYEWWYFILPVNWIDIEIFDRTSEEFDLLVKLHKKSRYLKKTQPHCGNSFIAIYPAVVETFHSKSQLCTSWWQ